MIRLGMRRVAPEIVVAALVLATVVRVGIAVNGAIDPDESQHLHVAWLVSEGHVPYRDFWEHHLPFFHYAIAPLTAWLTDRAEVYFAARSVMAILAAAAVVLTWRLARRLSADGATWAALVLVFLPQFAVTSIETRPDVPALVAHLASLLAIVRWREGRGLGWLWAAGAWQGTAVALSLKGMFGLPGVVLVVALAPSPGPGGWRGRLAAVARFAGGLVVVLVALVGGFAAVAGDAAIRGLYRDVVRDSLGFVDFAKTWPSFGSELGAFLAAALGLTLVLRVRGLAVLRHPVHGVLLAPTMASVAILAMPSTPAVYQHAWLPLHPVVAIYASLALATLAEWARRAPSRGRIAAATLAIVVAIVIPAGESLIFAVRNRNASDLSLMRAQLRLACPGEPVLDGTALHVFRPAAYRHGALVRGVREWVARGHIAEEVLADDMRAARAPVAHVDFRIRGMIGPVADFLRRHYVPGPGRLLVVGADVAASTDGGRVVIDALRPGPYLLSFGPELGVRLDGRPAQRGWVDLAAGRHEVTWQGRGGAIRLVAATCPERRILGSPSS